MSEVEEEKRSPGSVPQLWLAPSEPQQQALPQVFRYHPAVMFECRLQFRDVRAEVVQSKEQVYTTWLPGGEGDLAVDWSQSAVETLDPERLESAPRTAIQPYQAEVTLTNKRMDEIEEDLVDHLVRHESLRLLYNPYLKWYSRLGEEREDFLNRLRDEVLMRIQPELKDLARRLQLQVEQLRERPLPEGLPEDEAENLKAARRRLISDLENKMEALIMENTGALTNPLLDNGSDARVPDGIREMKEDLDRIEQEIFHDLNALVTDRAYKACECQEYEIKLQPTDIRIIRRALLWVPVIGPPPKTEPAGR